MESNTHLIRTAKVIDDVDPEEKGRVQVRVFPELAEVDEDSLPWARPWNGGELGVGDETGSHNPPEIDSFVKVRIIDPYWKDFYYEPTGSYVEGKYIYEKISEIDIEEIEAFEYPQPRFRRTKDGTVYFHNTENGDCGIKHSTGAYSVINSEGDIINDAGGSKIIMLSSGDVEIDTGGVNFFISADGEITADADKLIITGELQVADGSDSVALFSPLSDILQKLVLHRHTAPTGPTTPAEEADGTPLSAYLGDIFDIESEVSTTD